MEGDTPRQCHTTFGVVERASDGGFLLKAYKQKLFVDGLSYLLQEIYGLENKSADVHPHQVLITFYYICFFVCRYVCMFVSLYVSISVSLSTCPSSSRG
jgi:hypothetical protein